MSSNSKKTNTEKTKTQNILNFVKTEKKEKMKLPEISTVLQKYPQMIIASKHRFIGGHVSCFPSFNASVMEALSIGANCFALYLKSSRQWSSKLISQKDASEFKSLCAIKGFKMDKIVPHGSLLLNCGSPKLDVLTKSRKSLIEELEICRKLGIKMYNFHPGSALKTSTPENCIALIAESVNSAIQAVGDVVLLLENSAGQGSTVGRTFEELKAIIDKIEDKSRVGVCFDTCHAFAAGYDISTESGYHKTMDEFDRVLGFGVLKAFHLNDSKEGLNSRKDRHESIGHGKIGIRAFEMLVNDGRFADIPMILETPLNDRFDNYSHEIKILNNLIV